MSDTGFEAEYHDEFADAPPEAPPEIEVNVEPQDFVISQDSLDTERENPPDYG
jgi:hypothetical protein